MQNLYLKAERKERIVIMIENTFYELIIFREFRNKINYKF